MYGEFTNHCKQYYELLCRLQQLETRFNTLLANALPYTGQTRVAELDAIIRCNRKIQMAYADANDCRAALHKTGHTIVQIMAYFEIPPNTTLSCEIPGQYELNLWADDEKQVHCIKTNELDELVEAENMLTIPFIMKRYNLMDDEEE